MYYLMVDTETANTLDDPFVYDFGFAVIDENGETYETHSFVNADIFLDKDLMTTAYFKEKVPHYWDEIKSGKRELRRLFTIRKVLRETMKKYGIDTLVAHNIPFDKRAVNTTLRYETSSRFRYFFPFGTKFYDTLAAARQYFGKDENYRRFCHENEYLTSRNGLRFTAEILYRYLTNNNDFQESHTGLEDCLIEKLIFAECKRREKEGE